MKYKYLPHTADAKFVAYGDSLDEVFRNSAIAMFNILGETEKVKPKIKKKIKIKSSGFESLLYDFLDELLFIFETEKIFLHDVKDIKLDEEKFELSCILEGDNLENYELNSDIKAVTYSEMEIKKTDKGYEATVVVDI